MVEIKLTLLIRLGEALHFYGTSAPRIEAALSKLAEGLGLKGHFFSTPTFLTIAIDQEHGQILRQIRIQPGEINLYKLTLVDQVGDQVLDGSLTIEKAIKRLSEIEKAPSHFSFLQTLLAFVFTSVALALIFKGSYFDSFVSGVVGLTVGFSFLKAQEWENTRHLDLFLSAFFAGIVASIFKSFFIDIHLGICIISGLIVLIPGLSLTVGLTELATQNLASGTARMMGAMTAFLKLGFGAYLGVFIISKFLPTVYLNSPVITQINSPLIIITAIFVIGIGLSILFKNSINQMPITIGSALFSFTASFLATRYIELELGVIITSIGIGALSNLYAKRFNRPATTTILPSIILLVPGSIGFKGFNFLLGHNFSQGLESGLTMFMTAIAIVVGLFIGNLIIPPRRAL